MFCPLCIQNGVLAILAILNAPIIDEVKMYTLVVLICDHITYCEPMRKPSQKVYKLQEYGSIEAGSKHKIANQIFLLTDIICNLYHA